MSTIKNITGDDIEEIGLKAGKEMEVENAEEIVSRFPGRVEITGKKKAKPKTKANGKKK